MGAVVVELIFLGMTDLLSDGVRPAEGNGIVALHGSVKLRFDCVNPRRPVIEIEFMKTLAHPTPGPADPECCEKQRNSDHQKDK